MKAKHLMQRVNACIALAEVSGCCRRKFGCLILDPVSNVVISDGYNGTLRNAAGELCGETRCLRDSIPSGENLAIGCVHAEQNAIYNATRLGASVLNKWLFVNGEPCTLCAKAIIQVGISRVFCIGGVYASAAGVDMLENHGVIVHTVPKDAVEQDFADILIFIRDTAPNLTEYVRSTSNGII